MKKLRYDLLLVAAILLAAGALCFMTRPGGDGAWAVVTQDGKEIARYALAKSVRVTLGDGDYNILEIANGEAAIVEANCGDHTCVRTGGISKEGETIVCLPHKLTVHVVGGEASGLDAVSK